jgi:[ribosomal protein S5]-alanine N-acetyltransferase
MRGARIPVGAHIRIVSQPDVAAGAQSGEPGGRELDDSGAAHLGVAGGRELDYSRAAQSSEAGGRARGGREGKPEGHVAGRVFLRPPALSDRTEFLDLMRASRSFHRPWASAPTNDDRFAAYLADSRRPDFEAMLVCRHEDSAIVGFFNLSQIARGLLQSTYLGYAAGKPYAGQGYMREGLALVLRHAFLTLRLHRVEANIQPGNHASLALARGAGFRREGFSPRYLKIGGRWRDHERWAILSDEWRTRVSQPPSLARERPTSRR